MSEQRTQIEEQPRSAAGLTDLEPEVRELGEGDAESVHGGGILPFLQPADKIAPSSAAYKIVPGQVNFVNGDG